ncbi:S-layer homology domain-containing protein [Tumebacillus sp. ITR2]|uniref:S-layer homology domain-containing protein n=1 Tax=Tumebacillus amylolyticus TaxID=2801339 RepID=A0ABS1J779_9BACL|nr:S-layer homology domain-containing protein [Tumebacillus amylolyticus]MBL0386136.1 S-layer homology domain-containing protein [Tumebacillus amylolyticus]
MNRNFVKIAASTLLIAGLMAPSLSAVAATDTKAHVKVRVVGPNGFMKTEYLAVGAESFKNTAGDTVQMDKPTVLGALVDIAAKDSIDYTATTSQFGTYVNKINGVGEKTINNNTAWLFWVNGKSVDVGADQAELHDGDEVVWGFSDYTQTLYPKLEISSTHPFVGDNFTVKVTAQKTTYDANWNATTTTVPVEGASLATVNSDEAIFVTDKDGVATVKASDAGLLTLNLDKIDPATGLPLIIRSGDVNVLVGNKDAKFTDLNGYDWAAPSILKQAQAGIVVGDGSSHFEPGRAVTRGELAKMISLVGASNGDLNFGGEKQFSDVAARDHYNQFIQTVVRKNILSGDAEGTFRSNDGITRQELAIVVARLAGLSPETTDTLTFLDKGQIGDYAKGYVEAVVKAGYMHGYSEGLFSPLAYADRAEVALVLDSIHTSNN